MTRYSFCLVILFSVTSLYVMDILKAHAGDSPGMSYTDLQQWLNGYEEAWEELDADKAAQLFTEDASYQDDPFKEPYRGREGVHSYWTTVTADQQDVDFTYKILSITDHIGIVHWHSEFLQKSSGASVSIDGIFVLEFSQQGLCKSLKEWWHLNILPAEKT